MTQDIKPKQTSPSYPSENLENAINYARKLRTAIRDSEALIPHAMQEIGYSIGGGKGKGIYSVIKAFRLVSVGGTPGSLKVRISPFGNELLDARPGSPQWQQLAKKAALSPKVFNGIWNEAGLDRNNDQAINDYLIQKLGFTTDGAKNAVRTFRETMAFIGLGADRPIQSEFHSESDAPAQEESGSAPPRQAKNPDFNTTSRSIEMPYFLRGGRTVMLRIDYPHDLTGEESQLVKSWIPYATEDLGK